MPAPRSRTLLALLLVVIAAFTPTVISRARARADVMTLDLDNSRTGWDQQEGDETGPGLDPTADVRATDFGQLWKTPVDGEVYASPLVVTKGGTKVVVVGTETNWIYGLDPTSGSVLWSRNVGPSWKVSWIGCTDLVPDIGITSTGVYDPASGYVYVTAKKDDGPDRGSPSYWLEAFDPLTGAERPGWPVKIQGHPDNNPSVTFSATYELQRTALTLVGGEVYLGFGSHCDYGDYYSGYVVGVSTTSGTIDAMWSAEATAAKAGGAGIWEGGGGLVTRGAHDMWLVTGNAGDNAYTPKPGTPGTSPPAGLSESVVHLTIGDDHKLTPVDFFAPPNADTLDTNDQDLGSGGLVDLPPAYFGTTDHPHLMVAQGKAHVLYLLDSDHLGGRAATSNDVSNVLQKLDVPTGGQWGHPAVYGGDGGHGGYIYVLSSATSGNGGGPGSGGPLTAYAYGTTAGGEPSLSVAATTAGNGYSSGSPVVTSDGTTPGSGLVWLVSANHPPAGTSGYCSSSSTCDNDGHLLAFPAVPTSGSWTPVFSADLGPVSKFTVPATDAGHVYVGTWGSFDYANSTTARHIGAVFAFGRPTTTPLSAPSTDFGQSGVTVPKSGTVTLTAHQNVTITGATTNAPFAVDTSGIPAGGVDVAAGATFSLPVTFTPSTTGPATGTLTVAFSTSGTSGSTSVGLAGVGTQAGLSATPTSLVFSTSGDPVPTGSSTSMSVAVKNTGTSTLTFTDATGPSAPFSAPTLPAAGATLAPQATITVPVDFDPTTAGDYTDSLSLSGDGVTVTVPLSASAVDADPHLEVTPTATPLAFGDVPVGSTAHATITLANTGNVTVCLSTAKGPAEPFEATNPVSEGQCFAPGGNLDIDVTFAPVAPGAASSSYTFDAGDGQGRQVVTMTGAGVLPATPTPTDIPSPTATPTATGSPPEHPQPTPASTLLAASVRITSPRLTFTATIGRPQVHVVHGAHGVVLAVRATVPVHDASGHRATLVLLLRRGRHGWTGTATLTGKGVGGRRVFATNGVLDLRPGRFAGAAHSRGQVLRWRFDGDPRTLR
ncbi:MAG TPA: choice-of-anchor D domain-containing protein [Mycobacteriales bacterium]|nr:choice-of-anchor D domain-containing protein [Mycobacteriales bacterium]